MTEGGSQFWVLHPAPVPCFLGFTPGSPRKEAVEPVACGAERRGTVMLLGLGEACEAV